MMHRATVAVAVVLFAGAATASAQQAAAASTQQKWTSQGKYATMPVSADTMRMPDGQMLVASRYGQVTFSSDSTSPLNNSKARCTSVMAIGKDGKPVSNSGSCFSLDAAGNGESFWWRQTEAATATCPAICGQWNFYSGYGKFANISGGGTWKAVAAFPDGTGMGTWEGNYETH